MNAIPTSSATAAASVRSRRVSLFDEDSEDVAGDVTVRTGTDVVGFAAPGAVLVGAAPFVCPVETFGVALGAGVPVVGVGVGLAPGAAVVGGLAAPGAGVVVGAVAVDAPGGGAKTAAPATTGTASASAAIAQAQAVAWMIEGGRIGSGGASEDTACPLSRQMPSGWYGWRST
jgi:hypothetical protein